MSRRPWDYGWWLVSRASGTVALVLVTAAVLLGLSMAAGLLRRPGLKKAAMGVHEHVALVALVAIAVHGIAMLGDRSINPGPVGVLVPFAMSYRPAYTGVGILSGYAVAALALSFYARRRIGAARWRRLHGLIVVAYLLGVAHAIGAGSDASSPAVRLGVVASVVPAAVLFVLRDRRRVAVAARRVAPPVVQEMPLGRSA